MSIDTPERSIDALTPEIPQAPGANDLEEAYTLDSVADAVNAAARVIAPYWPIDGFIANNPLGGLEDLTFAEATRLVGELRGARVARAASEWLPAYDSDRITDDVLEAVILETRLTRNETFESHTALAAALRGWLVTEARRGPTEDGARGAADVTRLADAGLQGLWETETLARLCQRATGRDVTGEINRRMFAWLASFLDDGQASWSMPERRQGFYGCWRALASRDLSLRLLGIRGAGARAQSLPERAADALAALLERMGVPRERWRAYLARHLVEAPGWAGLIRYREEHPDARAQSETPINLVEYLAARLFYEAEITGQFIRRGREKDEGASLWERLAGYNQRDSTVAAAHARTTERCARLEAALASAPGIRDPQSLAARLAPECDSAWRDLVWLAAAERSYRQSLIERLEQAATGGRHGETPQAAAGAQLLFCIDVRSEGLRRQVEAQGPFETFGVAGFFGVPARYRALGSEREIDLCPAPLRPSRRVAEIPLGGYERAARRSLARDTWRAEWHSVNHGLRERLLTPFAFVEATGLFSALPLLWNTVGAGLTRMLAALAERRAGRGVPTTFTLDESAGDSSTSLGIPLEEQVSLIEGMLRAIGLTDEFARVVALIGHGSQTVNNPYAAGLDCGACGGRRGQVNARMAATLLNSPAVRQGLARRGIVIPEETLVIAGEHNTVTDEVTLFDLARTPESHRQDLVRLRAGLRAASAAHAASRARTLSLDHADTHAGAMAQSSAQRDLRRRATDWSEQRPEWGLAGAAVFICGRRSLTAGTDLAGRAFLHSYDPMQDPDGSALEGILAAPLVVAEWISMQYYFSTVDNSVFGSGTKVRQTVIGGVGTVEGRRSDLKIGLPLQSVSDGTRWAHEPLRLLALVEAPVERIESVLGRQPGVARLIEREWITVVARDPETGAFLRRLPASGWRQESGVALTSEQARARVDVIETAGQ